MKLTRKFIAVILTTLLLTLPIIVLASAEETAIIPTETAYWDNLDYAEANALLNGAAAQTAQSFILVVGNMSSTDAYSNSAYLMPIIYDYAQTNSQKVNVLNTKQHSGTLTNISDWITDSSNLVLVFAYNANTKTMKASSGIDAWDGTKGFKTIIESAGFTTGSYAPGAAEAITYSSQEAELLQLVNRARIKAGVTPLTMTSVGQEAADIRSAELLTLFSNTRPNGFLGFTALFVKSAKRNFYPLGTNINSTCSTAASVMEDWMNSVSSKNTILNSAYDHIGISYTTSGTQHTWAQLFYSNGDACTVDSVKLNGVPTGTVASGTAIDDMGIIVETSCAEHGKGYAPLISEMCTGFDSTKNGAQTVTVSFGGKITTFSVTLNSVSVTSVAIDPAMVTIPAGSTKTLSAVFSPADASNKAVTWVSSNPAVATVGSSTGLVSAITEGTSTITVTTADGGKTATCIVNVSNDNAYMNNSHWKTLATLADVQNKLDAADSASIIMYYGENCSNCSAIGNGVASTWMNAYGVDVYGANSSRVNLASDISSALNLTGTTYNTPVMVFVKNGNIVYAKQGCTNANAAELANEFYSVFGITAPTGVTLDSYSANLKIGETKTLTATLAPAGASSACLWNSSKESVATVSNGRITAVSAGTATITVTTIDGAKTAACNVTVTGTTVVVPVTSVTLNASASTVEVSKAYQLAATVAPSNATDKRLTWTSSNPSVATVTQTGLVSAVALGKSIISVSTIDGGKIATCEITVIASSTIPAEGVSLSASSTTLTVKDQYLLTATVLPNNASNQGVTWSSSNPAVASVNQSGVVTALSQGYATITVTTADGARTAQCYITVNNEPTPDNNTSFFVQLIQFFISIFKAMFSLFGG